MLGWFKKKFSKAEETTADVEVEKKQAPELSEE